MFGRILAGTFRAAVAALLYSACRGEDPDESIRNSNADQRASEFAALRRLPRCMLPPVGNLAGWVRVAERRLALPPSFQPETTSVMGPGGRGVPRYMHGGLKWTDGPRAVEMVGGHWGVESFTGPGPRLGLPVGWCRAELSGRLTVVMSAVRPDSARRFWAAAWVADRPSPIPLAPMYRVEGPWTDREVLLRILATVRPEDTLGER